MTTPTDDQLAAAAQKARADHETARAIAARLLAPPDPVDILAGVIADRGDVADERDELRAERDALTADLVAIRGIVGRHRAPIAEAVRQIRDELIRERDLARADRDAARESTSEASAIASDGLREIACALGLPADQAAIADLVAKVGDLSSSLSTAEKDAETQRTVVADLCAVLDRVAMEAGVDTEGDGFDVADRVISVLRAMQVRPVLTVERLADALRAANVTLQPTTTAFAVMAAMSHMGDLVLPESSPTSRPAALPAGLRTDLETLLNRLQGTDGLAVAAETAALKRWIALPTAEVAP